PHHAVRRATGQAARQPRRRPARRAECPRQDQMPARFSRTYRYSCKLRNSVRYFNTVAETGMLLRFSPRRGRETASELRCVWLEGGIAPLSTRLCLVDSLL